MVSLVDMLWRGITQSDGIFASPEKEEALDLAKGVVLSGLSFRHRQDPDRDFSSRRLVCSAYNDGIEVQIERRDYHPPEHPSVRENVYTLSLFEGGVYRGSVEGRPAQRLFKEAW